MATDDVEMLLLRSSGSLPLSRSAAGKSVYNACAERLGVGQKDLEVFKLKRVHRGQEYTNVRSRIAVLVKESKNSDSDHHTGNAESSGDANCGLWSMDRETYSESASEFATENEFLLDKIEALEDALLAFQDMNTKLQLELQRKDSQLTAKEEAVKQLELSSMKDKKEIERWKKKHSRASPVGTLRSPSSPALSPNTVRSVRTVNDVRSSASSPARRRSSGLLNLEAVSNMTCRICSCGQFVARQDVRWICHTCQHTVVKHVQKPHLHESPGRSSLGSNVPNYNAPGRVSPVTTDSFPRRSVSAPKPEQFDFTHDDIFSRTPANS